MATLAELVVAVGLMITATATAFPELQTGLDNVRSLGAARYVAARLADARMEAIQRSTEVAVRFTATPGGYAYAVYVDGNGNGVLSRDIQRGIDRPIGGLERLSSQFHDVEFGALAGLPGVDGGVPPGDDPIRLGSGNSVSFSPLGTSSSGTIYLLGRRHTQYAVRVRGVTGRIQVYRFNWPSGDWTEL